MNHVTGSLTQPGFVLPRWPGGPLRRLTVYWLVFAVSVLAYVAHVVIGDRLPALSLALLIVGMVPCGFAWLLARALFRTENRTQVWPEAIVAVLFVLCVALHLGPSDDAGGIMGYAAQLQAWIGSAVLLMAFVEAIESPGRGHKNPLTPAERRFRRRFGAGYLTLIFLSFLFVLPELSAWRESAQATMALMALIGATAAWRYRLRHPLSGPRAARREVAAQPDLARSIRCLFDDEHVHLDAGLKVAELAARLGEPDYKISRCITGDLGYRNANQLINAYRLDEAKRRLSDPGNANLSILTIAMDCGFGSLGPFNRTFKAQTGMTPTAFRRDALRGDRPSSA